MNRYNHDLIGSALGFPGAWGPGWGGWGPAAGTTAFGGNEFPDPALAGAALAHRKAQMEAYHAAMAAGMAAPFQGGCGPAGPSYLDPAIMNAMIASQGSVIVGSDYGPQATEQMIGQSSELVLEPGQTGSLEYIPELVAKLVRFFLVTKCASQLSVLDITIGIKSQLPGKGRIPGLVYSEVSTNNRINGDTCYIRQPVVALIKNVSESSCTVESAVGMIAVDGAGPRIVGNGYKG